MKYTFSDDEIDSDGFSVRRSTRNSGVSTPLEDRGPTVTASGRQVKSRYAGFYGESMLVDQRKDLEPDHGGMDDTSTGLDAENEGTRPLRGGHLQRSGRATRVARPRTYGDEPGSDEESEAPLSAEEWSGNENESDDSEPDNEGDEEDEEMSEAESDLVDEEDDGNNQESLVVQLRYRKGSRKADCLNGISKTYANGYGGKHEEEIPPEGDIQERQLKVPQVEGKLASRVPEDNIATATADDDETRMTGQSPPLPNGIGHSEVRYPLMTA